ncbi:hypothetical protein FKP32DRAFT_1717707 [Trametes sanguinea]|nr:hypothetical protein FKP32DRAFT_1717707 [Trametes sanguinea]
MKMAQFQTRLVSVLDELDAQRHSYQRELHKERRAKEKLSNKLDGYLDEVRRAEHERDDMRELVSVLLEKVESCHNYSAWPCPRIGLAYPLRQSDTDADKSATQQEDGDAVSGAVINTLRRQLTEEKLAHIITREEAEAEIARLRAMIARRDAELEACATHDGHRILLSSSGPVEQSPVRLSRHSDRTDVRTGRRADSGKGSHGVPVGNHAATEHDHVLARTMSRNRALEQEVEFLKQRVGPQENLSAYRRKADDASGPSSAVSQGRYVSSGVQTFEPKYSMEFHEDLPPSPGLLPSTMPCSPSPYYLTPRQGRPRPLKRLSGQHTSPQRDRHSPTAPHIQALAEDVNQFSTELSDFIIERTALKAMLSREQRQVSRPSDRLSPVGHPSLAFHDRKGLIGVVYIPREQQALREQLDALARQRNQREEVLEAEIASLRQSLLGVQGSVPQIATSHSGQDYTQPAKSLSPNMTSDDTRASHGEDDSLYKAEGDRQPRNSPHDGALLSAHGDDLGERPMELATPLQTTILSLCDEDWLVPPAHPASPPHQIEATVNPADVPLPESPDEPESISAPLLSPVFPPPSSSPPRSSPLPLHLPIDEVGSDLLRRMESATEERIADIEQQIAATQRHLEERQAALSALSPVQDLDSDPPVQSEGDDQHPAC